MRYLITLSLALITFSGVLNAQNNEEISLDNPVYVEWVSTNGFKFISEFKDGEAALDASDVIDNEGNPISSDVTPATFDITKYDFETIIAPSRNTIIKISEDKAIFINSMRRQEILFKRFLINQAAQSE